MKPTHEKSLIVLICFLGIAGISYGMNRENHVIFLVGIGLVVAGYLIIRAKLKG